MADDLPENVEGLIASEGEGPGEGEALFPWLADIADLEQCAGFSSQEVAGKAGFEDLVAVAQVKTPTRPKTELARTYWGGTGRGVDGDALPHAAEACRCFGPEASH